MQHKNLVGELHSSFCYEHGEFTDNEETLKGCNETKMTTNGDKTIVKSLDINQEMQNNCKKITKRLTTTMER